ncbi:MAG TPA: lipopolysaccharide transport periplasmic protein LptA [Burkholderiales bacterium]|nr:lipopolysaccharide transport periplasmic protein LptA [Burkholderiales bacterium]
MKNKWLLAFFLLFSLSARAEKADREQPIHIDADKIEIDDAKKVNTFEGNVVLTQGTLTIKADKVVVTQDAAGNKHATAYSETHPVYFRQKREGYDEYVEGQGDRAEYDSKTDTVELFGNAYVKRGQDIVKGNYISYDSNTEFFQSSGGAKKPEGRVHAVIQPGKKEAPKAPPLKIEPSQTLDAR